MRTQIVFFILVAVCLTLNSPVLATDRLVPSQYPTIQAGIDAAVNGDVVIVDPNTYTGTGNRDIDFKGKAITVRSIDPNDPNVVTATIIDCQGTSSNRHRGFFFHSDETPSSVLAGLKIINGYATEGGGILCTGGSSPTITHCVIADNLSNKGGAIMSIGHFIDDESPFFVMMYDPRSNPNIRYCTITRNRATGSGGGIHSERSVPTIRNCTITGNRSDKGGALYFLDANPTVSNCTISANQGGNRGGGMYCYMNVNATVINSIFWDNEAPGGAEFYLYYSNELSVSYCDIEGGWEGVNNIDDDPCFVAPGHWDTNGLWLQGNYHLSIESPCINAGNPAYNPAPGETDIDGEPRVINACVDMGSDEFNGEGPVIEVWPLEFEFFAIEGGTNPESQILSIRNSGLGTLNWEILEDCDWLEAIPDTGSSMGEVNDVSISVDTSDLKAGFYDCVLIVSGADALGSKYSISVNFWIIEALVYVPKQYPTIQEAIDEVAEGVVVIVEPNTYTGPGNKNLDFRGKAITVRSFNPEDPCVVAATVIDCENSGRGFYFHSGEEANSVLAGFTIQRGRVYGNPAKGGGIYCSGSSPTIKNCIIRNNRANGNTGGSEDNGRHGYGGGIFCTSGSRPTVVGCMITENAAVGGPGGNASEPTPFGHPGMGGHAFGGGIYGSGLTIEECVINNNSALGGAGGYDVLDHSDDGAGGDSYGGGIYGSVTISNSIISGNAARAGVGGFGTLGEDGEAYGGGLYGGSTINNCLIIDNVADDRVDVSSYVRNAGGGVYGGAVLANCTISGNVVVDNIGGVAGAATIINCILWGNGDDLGGCSATYSCIEDGDAGEGNIHDNPRFVTGPLGNYYLSQIAAGQAVDSPCVDAGSDTAINLGMNSFTTRTDHIGDLNVVDMGFHYPVPIAADINKDWSVDFYDYAILASQWKATPGMPPADIAPPCGDDIVDGKDLAMLIGYWLWRK